MSSPNTRLEADDVRDKIQATEDLLRILSEAGLFSRGASGDRPPILDNLNNARTFLAQTQLPQANASFLDATTQLDDAVQSRSFFWRLVHVHRLFLFFYLVAAFAFLLNAGSGFFTWIADDIWIVPTKALGFGALGAVLRSLYWLYRQVAKRIFRTQFALAHLASPFIGALMGAFSFLLVKGGLLVLQEGRASNVEDATLPLAFCFLAGFSWEWLLSWVDGFVGGGANSSPPPPAANHTKPDPAPPAATGEVQSTLDAEAKLAEEALESVRAEAIERDESIEPSFLREIGLAAASLRELEYEQVRKALQAVGHAALTRQKGAARGRDVRAVLAGAAEGRADAMTLILRQLDRGEPLEKVVDRLREG